MIYNLVTTELKPGKMAEWGEVYTKEIIPLFPKLGLKIAGSFHAYTGNMNEMRTLFVYEDPGAMQKILAACYKDKEFVKAYSDLNSLTARQSFTLIEPNPWSPMK